MRKLAIAMALSSTLLATPAFARDGAWYVGGEFGAMIVEDTNVDIGAVNDAIRLSHEYGYDGGLFVGYDLGAFRLEAEAAYKKADLEGFTTSIRLPGEGINFPTGRAFAGGNTSVLSFMVNGMLDFGDDDGISGFVGGGVGMARVKANNQRVFANTAPFLDDSDSKLAWQVFAGVRQAITDNIDVTVKYRFFNVSDVRMTAFNGNESELRFRSHSLLGGLTFNFGGRCKDGSRPVNGECPEPDPEVVWCESLQRKIPAGADCPVYCTPREDQIVDPNDPTKCILKPCEGDKKRNAAGVCVTPCPDEILPDVEGNCRCDVPEGPALIFFDWDKYVLVEKTEDTPSSEPVRPNQSDILDQVAKIYRCGGQVRLHVSGHADRSGRPSYNNPLSKARAQTIVDELVTRAIPLDAIRSDWFGEDVRRKETPDGVKEVENRRVEIVFER